MKIKKAIINLIKKLRKRDFVKKYVKRFEKYAFVEKDCKNSLQYEAVITKLYHAVEKGLSYENYKPGFGQTNIQQLLYLMQNYAKQYDINAFFYQTALDVLHKYVEKNKQFGYYDSTLETSIQQLPGTANSFGGTISFEPLTKEAVQSANYFDFIHSRHSIRHFTKSSLDITDIKKAIELAQHTPSACNRQGWKTIVVTDKNLIKSVLENQNGNRGFGENIDILLVVVADLCYFNRSREHFQPYVDGGMYSMRLLDALHYEHIGTVPLSAALTLQQEAKIKNILHMKPNESIIMFIGCGKYPTHCLTTRSERKEPIYTII